jgi:hypothetical protein
MLTITVHLQCVCNIVFKRTMHSYGFWSSSSESLWIHRCSANFRNVFRHQLLCQMGMFIPTSALKAVVSTVPPCARARGAPIAADSGASMMLAPTAWALLPMQAPPCAIDAVVEESTTRSLAPATLNWEPAGSSMAKIYKQHTHIYTHIQTNTHKNNQQRNDTTTNLKTTCSDLCSHLCFHKFFWCCSAFVFSDLFRTGVLICFLQTCFQLLFRTCVFRLFSTDEDTRAHVQAHSHARACARASIIQTTTRSLAPATLNWDPAGSSMA